MNTQRTDGGSVTVALPEWQPIDTAPVSEATDGTHDLIMLWVADAHPKGRPATGYTTRSVWSDKVSVHANGFSGGWNITHWMPLPAPPKMLTYQPEGV